MPDLSTYVGVIATAWPGSFGREAVLLHEGADHDVVAIGTRVVFRFPKHDAALAALPHEVAALAALKGAHPDVAELLPEVLLDCSDAPLGRAFVAQRFLGGEPLPRAAVDAVGPMAYRFAMEIARVLDALASVPVDGLPLPREDVADPVVVHGDLRGANLRWDADEVRLTGVLDWAHVRVGDRAADLAGIAETYGPDLATTVAGLVSPARRGTL